MNGLIFLDTERCRGCQLCQDLCPNALFEQCHLPNSSGNLPMEIRHPEYCIACSRCVSVCPDRALSLNPEPTPTWPGWVYGMSLRWHRLVSK